jgi:hypothetical protein
MKPDPPLNSRSQCSWMRAELDEEAVGAEVRDLDHRDLVLLRELAATATIVCFASRITSIACPRRSRDRAEERIERLPDALGEGAGGTASRARIPPRAPRRVEELRELVGVA